MVLCRGITLEGKKCKNQAIDGKKFCHVHATKSKKSVKVTLVKASKPKVTKAKVSKIVHRASPDIFDKYYSEPAKKVTVKKTVKKSSPKKSPVDAKIANAKCNKLFEVYGQKEAERILDQNIEMGQIIKGSYKASPLIIEPRKRSISKKPISKPLPKRPVPKKPLPIRPVKKRSPQLEGYFDEEIYIPKQYSSFD
ncbi:MAG TPA: hypothetical protein PKD85_01915 [Saprospiraceae bacterium]|nr:hypothetical protein [Saprospiraceae bacterium]